MGASSVGGKGKGKVCGAKSCWAENEQISASLEFPKRITLYREGTEREARAVRGHPRDQALMRPRTPETVGMASPVRKVLTLKRSCSPSTVPLDDPFTDWRGVTPHKIAPKLGQVFLPHRRISCSSPFTNNKNSTRTARGREMGGARGLLGVCGSSTLFPSLLNQRRTDHISQEAVHKGGGVEGGRGGCLTAASWEA